MQMTGGGPLDGREIEIARGVHVLPVADDVVSSEHGVLVHEYVQDSPATFRYDGARWV